MIELLLERAPIATWLLVFAFGAVVGSFLNVVIGRLPAGESLVHPPSRCPKCATPIAPYDNIPVLAWLWLRGKCRACGQPISARYPLVELLVGLLAVALLRRFGPTWPALGYFAFVAALVALAYIDLDTWLLPHEITWPLIAVGLLSPLWNPGVTFFASAVGAVAGIAIFGGIALFGEKVLKREVMGWGDVWLLGGIGAWLGWQALLPVVLLSSLQGLVVGVIVLAVRKRKDEPPPSDVQPIEQEPPEDDWVPPPTAVPFGPFLALAAIEQVLLGPAIVLFYDRLTMMRPAL